MSIKKLLGSMTLASILSIAGGLTTTSVFAAEYKDPESLPQDSTIDDVFFDQVDDDRVLPMPDGGFLHGEIIEVDALYWVSVNDGGRVGNFSEAYDTLHGKLSGMELPANTGRYCWTLNGQQYYTYNPLPNTYYIVVNK